MIIDILLGILLSFIILYLWVLYVEWGDSLSFKYEIYKVSPKILPVKDRELLDKWGWALPPDVISNSYKYIYFWVIYTYVKMTISVKK